MDIFGLSLKGIGQGEEVIDELIELPAQASGVGLSSQGLQALARLLGDGVGLAEAVERDAGVVIAPPGAGGVVLGGGKEYLVHQVHDGPEEVVVEPHLVVEVVEGEGLLDGVQPFMAQESADEGGVLLLDVGVVVFVEGAAAGEVDMRGLFFPEAQEMVVEELAAVVGVDLQEREGEAGQDLTEAVLHDAVAAAQDGDPFAPAGGDVDHLGGADILAGGVRAAVVDEVDLEVAWGGFISGDTAHRDGLGEGAALAGSGAGQARGILVEAGEGASDGGDADVAELLQEGGGEAELPMDGGGVGRSRAGWG